METNEACILCGPTGNIEYAGDTVEVARGLNKLAECSVSKGDDVREQLHNNHSVVVHVKCRKEYTRRAEPTPKRLPRPQIVRQEFDFKTQCVLCCQSFVRDASKLKKPARHERSLVETLEIVKTMRVAAEKRNDAWGRDVLVRIGGVIDLVAAEGWYHRRCYQSF